MVPKKISCLQNKSTHPCQTGAFRKSEYIKKILLHLLKVYAKHSHRRVVHQWIWRFGIGGSRPNGFILTQRPCMQAHWLPVALSTGQKTPQSVIHCCLSICMLFSCPATLLFQSASSYVILFQNTLQSLWCFKWPDILTHCIVHCLVLMILSLLSLFSTTKLFD